MTHDETDKTAEYWRQRHDTLLQIFSDFMGEQVPPEVSLIDLSGINDDDIERAKQLIAEYGW